jgi:hypothetical protein
MACHDAIQKARNFQAIFGVPYPNNDSEWQVISPIALGKLNELAESLHEKRRIRDTAYEDLARADELQRPLDADHKALETNLQNSIVQTTQARKMMDTACELTEDMLSLPDGNAFVAGQAPCDDPEYSPHLFTTTEAKQPLSSI